MRAGKTTWLGQKKTCTACGEPLSRDKERRCIECVARTLGAGPLGKTKARRVTDDEKDALERLAHTMTVREFQRHMARQFGVYRTYISWCQAAKRQGIKFTAHQPTVTASELARLLGVTCGAIRYWIKRGKIATTGRGHHHQIPYEEVERLLADNPFACPFPDPIKATEAAQLLGYSVHLIKELCACRAVQVWAFGGINHLSRAEVMRLKGEIANGRELSHYLTPERLAHRRAKARAYQQKTRLPDHPHVLT